MKDSPGLLEGLEILEADLYRQRHEEAASRAAPTLVSTLELLHALNAQQWQEVAKVYAYGLGKTVNIKMTFV